MWWTMVHNSIWRKRPPDVPGGLFLLLMRFYKEKEKCILMESLKNPN